MRLRITKVNEFQFLTCVQHSIWGSKSARFKDWQPGDLLIINVSKRLAGLAEVTGAPYFSRERVWDNDIFPNRIPLKFTHILLPEDRPPILGEIRDILISVWGPRYGHGILNQLVLEGETAEQIVKTIKSLPNKAGDIQKRLGDYLEEAKLMQDRDAESSKKRGRPGRPRKEKTVKDTSPSGNLSDTKEDVPTHAMAQDLLIQLGRNAGCSVWIASNDRNREYNGKALGESCLKNLPNLGLNEEAVKRISLIDIIWLQKNAPVCAFEVEATTSVYSGLLRMSDLLSVIPAINIKLFIVAPRARQDKVLSELSRPTFQKIGLSEFCRFIPLEDLVNLVKKVRDLTGHIQPSILDTIAIELDEDGENDMT